MALTDQITRLGADERAEQATKWARLARAAQRRRLLGQVALIAVLTVISLPIILPYLWMILISFTAKLGEPDASALWSACLAIFPAVVVIAAASALMPKGRMQTWVIGGAIVLALCALAILLGPELHLSNYRFMVTPNLIEDRMGEATAGGQFPWVWTAFGNSLILAGAQTVIVVTVSTLAGYYLSRFAFPGPCRFPAGTVGPAGVSGDDPDHSDLSDRPSHRAAEHPGGPDAGDHRAGAAVLHFYHEGLL